MSITNGVITAPVSMTDIKTTLGLTSGSLIEACKSSAINPKATCKPINIGATDSLTLAQRKALNYGLNINAYENPIALVHAIVNGSAYSYNNSSLSSYRQLYFDGYKHNTGDWLTLTTSNGGIEVNSPTSVGLTFNNDVLTAMSDLLELGYLSSQSSSSLWFSLLLSPSFSANTTSCYILPPMPVSNVGTSFWISTNILRYSGTYYIIPVLFTERDFIINAWGEVSASTTDATWYPIPFCNMPSIEVIESDTPDDGTTWFFNLDTGYGTGEMYFFDNESQQLEISTDSEDWSGVVYITNAGNEIQTNSQLVMYYEGFGINSIEWDLAADLNVEIPDGGNYYFLSFDGEEVLRELAEDIGDPMLRIHISLTGIDQSFDVVYDCSDVITEGGPDSL